MGGIIFIILVIAVIMLVAMYNGLVRKKKLVDNAW